MGITTGFLSGVTLTSLTVYLTLSLHRQIRTEQSRRLALTRGLLDTQTSTGRHARHDPRQQLQLSKDNPREPGHDDDERGPIEQQLHRLAATAGHDESNPRSHHTRPTAPYQPTPTDTDPDTSGLGDRLKARWNTELTNTVRRTQQVDWNTVSARIEDGVARSWAAVMQRSRDGVETVEGAVRDADLGASVERLGQRAVGLGREAGARARDVVNDTTGQSHVRVPGGGRREGY